MLSSLLSVTNNIYRSGSKLFAGAAFRRVPVSSAPLYSPDYSVP